MISIVLCIMLLSLSTCLKCYKCFQKCVWHVQYSNPSLSLGNVQWKIVKHLKNSDCHSIFNNKTVTGNLFRIFLMIQICLNITFIYVDIYKWEKEWFTINILEEFIYQGDLTFDWVKINQNGVSNSGKTVVSHILIDLLNLMRNPILQSSWLFA